MKEIFFELNKFSSEILSLNPPVDPNAINKFEELFDLTLPSDYKELLKTYNGLSLMGDQVFGIFTDKRVDSLDSVYEYEHSHSLYRMPNYYIPFSPDGAGNHYCFDVRKLDDLSCPIIFWQSGYQYTRDDVPEVTNNSFENWMKEVLIGWTLEEYDYNGEKR